MSSSKEQTSQQGQQEGKQQKVQQKAPPKPIATEESESGFWTYENTRTDTHPIYDEGAHLGDSAMVSETMSGQTTPFGDCGLSKFDTSAQRPSSEVLSGDHPSMS
eukprot:GDKI01011635.1.p1 GENE.GDKI01011635.1~~GDKI01011635.1.p1  ORF type:complete len:105 (+),score=26.94 GDKI01011635.1:123-437(+)